jgi:hypothetical protein
MASAPYNSLNGVNLVALDSVVLCDQMTLDNSSAHFPFFWSKRHFFIAEKIWPLALFWLRHWIEDDTQKW